MQWAKNMQGRERQEKLGNGKFETAEKVSGLLGAFANLRKVTISFVMSVRLPAC
jgi:hypothetical protein